MTGSFELPESEIISTIIKNRYNSNEVLMSMCYLCVYILNL